MQYQLVLEKSSNTHLLESPAPVTSKEMPNGIQMTVDTGRIVHGEHGIIGISGNICKFNQQELNPVTKQMQNAYD